MQDPQARIEGLGKDDFIDDVAQIEVREISSGKGHISASPGSDRRGSLGRDLEPDIIYDASGRPGWRVRIPGSRPLATPAVVGGRVFIGGGFGSHEFYALDLETGRLLWSLKTKDDGPTAATVVDGFVAFNTESCTVYVVEAETGRSVWERWLGDPLLAQPALDGSSLFMVYPDNKGRHWLAAFDLRTGTEQWKAEIVADVITAPILADGGVYAATIDGTVYHIDRETGQPHWAINHQATSAPWVRAGKVYLSLREEEKQEGESFTVEGVDTVDLEAGARGSQRAHARRKADYLKFDSGSWAARAYQAFDGSVGFASAPLSAKLHFAKAHLGHATVASMWSYQGSRPEVFDDGIFSVMGDAVQRLDLGTRKPLWRSRLKFGDKERLGRVLSPPAVTASRLYLVSALGDLIALDRSSGDELWSLNVGSEILSQAAVAEGKVVFGTVQGDLYAFETGDADPRGWPMWGGGPGHNG